MAEIESNNHWSDGQIWWHCYPLGFVGAPQIRDDTIVHRLPQLTHWLDYVVDLGATGLLLGPIFASTSHGYDTVDHFRIDPRLGDDGDFDALIAQAKTRGLRVVLDGVFNHVSADHPIVLAARAAGPDSAEGRWVHWVGEYTRGFEGNLDLVELNLEHPEVIDYVASVMNHWLVRGVDGWRLDAAYAAGAQTWRPIVERVRQSHDQVWIFAEVIHGDYAAFHAESGVDSVTEYELWKAIWSSLVDRNPHELAWTLGRHDALLDHFLPQTFIGNHDVTRIATRLDDPAKLRVAIALLLFVPGVPSIYAGDEQGFTGEKTDGEHGDDEIRPAFLDHPPRLSERGDGVFAEYQQTIATRARYPWLAQARVEIASINDAGIGIELVNGTRRLGLAINYSQTPQRITIGGQSVDLGPTDWSLIEPGASLRPVL